MSRFLIPLCFLMCSFQVLAQRVDAKFDRPFVKLGEPVKFTVVAEYPVSWQVVFPDSGYNFGKLICTGFKPIRTVSRDSISVDSAEYTLVTFELDSILSLSLPIYFFPLGDSTVLWTPERKLALQELLPDPAPDTLQFIANVGALPPSLAFNTPYWIAGGVVLLIVLVILLLIFGPRVLRQIQKNRVKKYFILFIEEFERDQSAIRQSLDPDKVEQAYARWKKLLQQISKEPFAALTGSEIGSRMNDSQLNKALQEVDIAIYSRKVPEHILQQLGVLKQTAKAMLDRKLAELDHR